MIDKCPGQDKRNVEAKLLKCPNCAYEVELFSDEIKARCPKCSNWVFTDVMPSCIDWCKYAKDCIGSGTYEDYLKDKLQIIKTKLIYELEKYFGSDTKRIRHAKRVMEYAEELLRSEGGDWHIVIPASLLHDVGIKVAEKKYGSAKGYYQEKEGPPIAKGILLKLSFKKDDITEICQIIAYHHSPGQVNTDNFRILSDADMLVNFKEEVDLADKDKIKTLIGKVFNTKKAMEIARKEYL